MAEKKTTKPAEKVKATRKPRTPKHIGLVANDAYLEPYEEAIRGRHDHAVWKINQFTKNGKTTLSEVSTGYDYYGLHRTARGWVFREWAPNATDIYLVGDFNDWKETEKYRAKRIKGTDDWELKLGVRAMKHGDLYKMHVHWNGGEGERIPAWAQRVVQDDDTKIFSAQVWHPETPYTWKKKSFKANVNPLLIYECHIGMAQDAEKVGSYTEFKDNVLPRVIADGYNCIQIMAIQEHPYYGSFGYHVSSFFAPSSRFGTPEELKALIDTAHQNGIAVIMDIVHSHAVKNEVEGLGNLAGDPNQYFYPGDRHEHPAWDSLCFDYGKDQVIHFLLSNCKYWLEEFHFDGFRFDGVTSMLYYSHGLGEAFCNYGDYFNGHEDDNAICYLTMANQLIHEVNPHAITIAEEVSGMPGLAAKFQDGGYGFDYRMAMNIPDYWIRHEHPAWDSLCFDYGKDQVIHFLLSNCKYWLEEFHFDGFRFDGVTSMLYYSHGLGEAFCNYGDYFNGHEDDNAICYLTMANQLIHEVNPHAITIAEEVSGMPGLAAKFQDGGYGFDYRMAMNIPDYWIKTIKELSDENWKPSSIFWEVKNRRPDEKTISYCESHDQALVGDKTIVFRLIDADMYWHFKKGDENEMVHRGIALHKMIRLVTAAAINGGYLNFMGNEFGHPEWIDFPREGNGWSYKYARRQWNLVDNHELCYHWLGDFDKQMLKVIKSVKNFQKTPVTEIWHNDGDQILAFMRGDLVFVFNFSPTRSFTDYGFLVPTGSYDVVLNTDSKDFGGNGLADDSMTHFTNFDPLYVEDHKEWLKLYIPARSAVVLKKN